MKKPVILWADLTINGGSQELRDLFERRCQVRKTLGQAPQPAFGARARPDFGFLEYDYPDRRSLAIFLSLKRQRPSIPLIMLTLTHSEELAIWAFRSGAWDYLTKPVSPMEVDRLCERMESLMDARTRNERRSPTPHRCDVPASSRYCARGDPKTSVSPALAYIQSHYAEKITEAELAKLCGMSKFRFSRTFREQCGVTFRECLLQWRVMKAAELLENPTLTITQVSFMVGFNDLSHFAKMFRRYFGRTASAYRQRLALRGSADDEPQSSPLTNPVNVSEGGLPLFLSHYDA